MYDTVIYNSGTLCTMKEELSSGWPLLCGSAFGGVWLRLDGDLLYVVGPPLNGSWCISGSDSCGALAETEC